MGDYMPRSKDMSRSEIEKLRGLSFKDKIWYIWNYYNYHIIGGIVIVAVLVSVIRTNFFSPDTVLFIAWDSPHIEYSDLDDFTDSLNNRLFSNDNSRIAEVSHFFKVSDDPQIMMQHYERLIAMVAAGAIDIFIVDLYTLEEYALLEFLLPLDEMLMHIKELDPASYELIAGKTVDVYYGTEAKTRTMQTAGIEITGSPLIQSFEVKPNQDVYLCVAISAKNLYNTALAIIEIFSQ